MLTYNIDTLDCLTNGTRGEVMAFHKNVTGVVTKIMIKFDEEHQGKFKRESNPQFSTIYPDSTPIEKVSFQYSLAKRTTSVSNTAKVIQYPLCLCFAATSHKFQGQTITKPNKSVHDLRTVFQAAQTYTMLSRVQNIDQVFILGSLPRQKFYADQHALEELERLDSVSVNKNPPLWEQTIPGSYKICSFNIRSLNEHLEDIKCDPIIRYSDIICLNETWLLNDDDIDSFKVHNYDLHLNSVGHGKGLAVYYDAKKFNHIADIKKALFQSTKMSSSDLDVITVYRSSGGNKDELLDNLKSLIDEDRCTEICGDFNFCSVKELNSSFIKSLNLMGFEEKVKVATHIKGGHIDHVYFHSPNQRSSLDCMLYSPYYPTKDHDAICSTVRTI